MSHRTNLIIRWIQRKKRQICIYFLAGVYILLNCNNKKRKNDYSIVFVHCSLADSPVRQWLLLWWKWRSAWNTRLCCGFSMAPLRSLLSWIVSVPITGPGNPFVLGQDLQEMIESTASSLALGPLCFMMWSLECLAGSRFVASTLCLYPGMWQLCSSTVLLLRTCFSHKLNFVYLLFLTGLIFWSSGLHHRGLQKMLLIAATLYQQTYARICGTVLRSVSSL